MKTSRHRVESSRESSDILRGIYIFSIHYIFSISVQKVESCLDLFSMRTSALNVATGSCCPSPRLLSTPFQLASPPHHSHQRSASKRSLRPVLRMPRSRTHPYRTSHASLALLSHTRTHMRCGRALIFRAVRALI